jgi:uroporphyrinogen decarboxylase
MGRSKSSRVPLVEYIVSENQFKPVVTDLLDREWVSPTADPASQRAYWDNFIAFWHGLGYDFVRLEMGLSFKAHRLAGTETIGGQELVRTWMDEHHGAIASWDDFERYEWPTVKDVDLSVMEYVASHLPEGMGLMTCHGGGIFEHVSQIMSLEGLCIASYEDPDLVAAVTEKVGTLLLDYYRRLIQLPNVIALFQGDDMGFVTGTLITPDQLRDCFLPWHAKFASLAHENGLPYFLHSCGNLASIMDDLIETVKIDGKHSFEDVIMPVEQFQARYGDRIAILGGVDINRLTLGTPEDVRSHARFLLETCGARGRYALGSGNSIPTYIPVENYLAMLDECHDFAGTDH